MLVDNEVWLIHAHTSWPESAQDLQIGRFPSHLDFLLGGVS